MNMRDDDLELSSLASLAAQEDFVSNLKHRHRTGTIWALFFLLATIIGIITLTALLLDILNDTSGYAVIGFKTPPASLKGGVPLDQLSAEQLTQILQDHVSRGRFNTLQKEKSLESRSVAELVKVVTQEVVKPQVQATYSLFESIFYKNKIFTEASEKYPGEFIVFRSWFNNEFLATPQSSEPLYAGIRTAILGSLWIIAIAMLVAFPLGIGAAIYLEEFAKGKQSRLNSIIQTNINNLAGVPSIIYGLLGLAVFVRVLEPLTSGKIFGLTADTVTANGRTVLSAGLTLALLILPVIIINAQEAIRAVPGSLREAGLGVGATKWQTVWSHVLPVALPGILTGSILAMSRAIGETAPLVVVGASTFITYDPSIVFSRFTALPIQIYQWTTRPQDEFHNLAAASIIALLLLLLSLNATAILLRNRYSRRYL